MPRLDLEHGWRVHHLPSLPEVVTEVARVVDDPRSGAAQVYDVMKKDASMVAKILQMVNSAFYGLSEAGA